MHIVFATKGRRPFIAPAIQPRLYAYMGGIIKHQACRLIAAGGVADHVRLLVGCSPKIAVADLMRLVKTNSSKWIHETFPDQRDFAWQDGYGAFSVSVSNTESVKASIAGQEEHHRHATFEEEFVRLLERHGIEYDPRFLWSA